MQSRLTVLYTHTHGKRERERKIKKNRNRQREEEENKEEPVYTTHAHVRSVLNHVTGYLRLVDPKYSAEVLEMVPLVPFSLAL
jgi:hypothetical protein